MYIFSLETFSVQSKTVINSSFFIQRKGFSLLPPAKAGDLICQMAQLWEGAVLVFSALHVLTGYFSDATRLGEWSRDSIDGSYCFGVWYPLCFCTVPGRGLR